MKLFNRLAQRAVLLIAGLALASAAHAGLSVSGTQLRETNGSTLVLRGINLPHAWFADRTDAALAQIAATGANSVRVVLSSGHRWNRTPEAEVARIIARCKSLGLIAVLEVHDTTGYGEDGAAGTLAMPPATGPACVARWWGRRATSSSISVTSHSATS